MSSNQGAPGDNTASSSGQGDQPSRNNLVPFSIFSTTRTFVTLFPFTFNADEAAHTFEKHFDP